MSQIRKILKLSDPYPNFLYEISCYVKAVLATSFLITGFFLIFHPLFFKISLFGVFETGLTPTGLKILAFFEKAVWPRGYLGFLVWGVAAFTISLVLFWRIKLVRKLKKILF